MIIRLIIFFSLLILPLGTLAGGSDYEAQLNHQLPRLSSAVSDLIGKNSKVVVDIVYIAYKKANAEALLNYHHGNGFIESFGKGRYKVKLRHKIESSETNPTQWIRNNFFIGISYHCDMDGLEIVEANPF